MDYMTVGQSYFSLTCFPHTLLHLGYKRLLWKILEKSSLKIKLHRSLTISPKGDWNPYNDSSVSAAIGSGLAEFHGISTDTCHLWRFWQQPIQSNILSQAGSAKVLSFLISQVTRIFFFAIFHNTQPCSSSLSAHASGNILTNFRLSPSWFEEIWQADELIMAKDIQ